jgi:putative hydrolase of HD superfamily
VFRQTHLSNNGRNENDAEHSWHMAVMAYVLKEYSNEKVDILKVLLMCLIHDIVEIDAGDTYAYDLESLSTQKEREERAKERIFSLLPEDIAKEFKSLFDEFESFETSESKFAHALDNLQPLMLNNLIINLNRLHNIVRAVFLLFRYKKGNPFLHNRTQKIVCFILIIKK